MSLGVRLTCKELAYAWEIRPTKVTTPRNAAFRKVALAMVLYPEKTLSDLAFYVDQAHEELATRSSPPHWNGECAASRP